MARRAQAAERDASAGRRIVSPRPRERHAARVLILDELDRILLVKGHDADRPERQWWFTIGGGLEPGETSRAAAAREACEETGLNIHPSALIGPVLQRSAIFDFDAEHVLQHEEFYLARIHSSVALSRAGWTELEKSFVDDLRWLTIDELDHAEIEVFPRELARLVANLKNGWDGTLITLGLEIDQASLAQD